MSKHYTTSTRIILCQRCGAPLEFPSGGGVVQCAYCDTHNRVTFDLKAQERTAEARSNAEAVAKDSTGTWRSERDREFVLQAKEPSPPGRPLVERFLIGQMLKPGCEQAAREHFLALRERVGRDATAEDELLVIALVLGRYYRSCREEAQRRALLDTALDALKKTEHQQMLRCELAKGAFAEGDVDSGDEWLSGCDPNSSDLHASSAYQVALFVKAIVMRDPTIAPSPGGHVADFYEEEYTTYNLHLLETREGAEGAVARFAEACRQNAWLRREVEILDRTMPMSLLPETRARMFDAPSIMPETMVIIFLGGIAATLLIVTASRDVHVMLFTLGVCALLMASLPLSGILRKMRVRRRLQLIRHGTPTYGTLLKFDLEGERISLFVEYPREDGTLSRAWIDSYGELANLRVGMPLPLLLDPKQPSQVYPDLMPRQHRIKGATV